LLLDPTPEPRGGVPDTWRPRPAPSARSALASAARELAGAPIALTGALARASRAPRRLARSAVDAGLGLPTLAGALRPVHDSSLTGPLAGGRRYTWVTVPLSDIDEVRRALDATVNDVALALVTGGVRLLLSARGEVPDHRALRVLVPVSTRQPGEEAILDNRVSLMLPFLPVDVADPVERLRVVQQRIRRLRRRHVPEAGEELVEAAGLGPFPPVAWGVRLGWRLPQHHVALVATNVPGPASPLYALGRRMRQVLPYVPIADRVRVGIAMFSYCGELAMGLTADRATATDLEVLARGIAESLDELRESLATSR
jgi:diacylglycerol O-acyltransferase